MDTGYWTLEREKKTGDCPVTEDLDRAPSKRLSLPLDFPQKLNHLTSSPSKSPHDKQVAVEKWRAKVQGNEIK